MDEEDLGQEFDYEELDYSDEEVDEEVNIIDPSEKPDNLQFYKHYTKKAKKRITDPCLTKYERTKVLSERAQQIDNGAMIYIPLTDNLTNAYQIAVEELRQRKLPFIICRPLPNAIGYEYWKLNDLMY